MNKYKNIEIIIALKKEYEELRGNVYDLLNSVKIHYFGRRPIPLVKDSNHIINVSVLLNGSTLCDKSEITFSLEKRDNENKYIRYEIVKDGKNTITPVYRLVNYNGFHFDYNPKVDRIVDSKVAEPILGSELLKLPLLKNSKDSTRAYLTSGTSVFFNGRYYEFKYNNRGYYLNFLTTPITIGSMRGEDMLLLNVDSESSLAGRLKDTLSEDDLPDEWVRFLRKKAVYVKDKDISIELSLSPLGYQEIGHEIFDFNVKAGNDKIIFKTK